MNIIMGEGHTKKSILLLLKKSGGMSIDELSKAIRITPMGIRQHVLSLEQKGLVRFFTRREGIGRPGYVYQLTEDAEALFPKKYDSFALEILRDMEEVDGRERVEMVFQRRYDRIRQKRVDALSSQQTVEGKVQKLKKILKSEGNFVEIWRHNGSFYLMQYNCPIYSVAKEFDMACRHELRMYKDLIGGDVIMKESMPEGSHSCLFEFPL